LLHADVLTGSLWSSGKWDGAGDLTEKEIIRFERNSGVVSGRVREIQVSGVEVEQK
jgi:hypothetical protein